MLETSSFGGTKLRIQKAGGTRNSLGDALRHQSGLQQEWVDGKGAALMSCKTVVKARVHAEPRVALSGQKTVLYCGKGARRQGRTTALTV